MLVVSRKIGEQLVVDLEPLVGYPLVVRVMVVEVRGVNARLGIETSPEVSRALVPIHRSEVFDRIQRERRDANVQTGGGAGVAVGSSAEGDCRVPREGRGGAGLGSAVECGRGRSGIAQSD